MSCRFKNAMEHQQQQAVSELNAVAEVKYERDKKKSQYLQICLFYTF